MIQYLQLMFVAKFPDRSERGASAVEYGLLVAGIAAVIVLLVGFLGDQVADAFFNTCRAIGGAAAACGDDPTP